MSYSPDGGTAAGSGLLQLPWEAHDHELSAVRLRQNAHGRGGRVANGAVETRLRRCQAPFAAGSFMRRLVRRGFLGDASS
jgi:hypothetical protein